MSSTDTGSDQQPSKEELVEDDSQHNLGDCESYSPDECPTDRDCLIMSAQPLALRGRLECAVGDPIEECRTVSSDCSDGDAVGYYCASSGQNFLTSQQCGPRGVSPCSPTQEVTPEPCPQRVEAESGGLYEDYCGFEPDSWHCRVQPFTLEDSVERAIAHPDLPSDAFLVGLSSGNAGGLMPDGRMSGEGFWRLHFASESTGSEYEAYVRGDSITVTAYMQSACTLEDEIEWGDVPDAVGEATQQVLSYIDWELQTNEFVSYYNRYADCLWTDWPLSYFQFQQLTPDATGSVSWTYVEYTLDGELTQVCRIDEDECVNLFGQEDP